LSCCRHPFAKRLAVIGWQKEAAWFDKLASSDETIAVDAKQEKVADIVLSNTSIPPELAAKVAEHIIAMFDTDSTYNQDWNHAGKSIARYMRKTLGKPELATEAAKLRTHWLAITLLVKEDM